MQKNNKTGLAISAVVMLAGTCNAAYAVDYIAKAAIGKKSTELIIRDRSFNPDFTTLDLSITGSIDRYFITFNNEFSIKDDVETDPNGLIFYSREDINITFGYGFDGFTAFAGVRSGDTDAQYTGNNGAFGTSSEGLYAGVSSSYFIEGAGNLTGSIAVASLDGEVSLSEPFVNTAAFTVTTPPATIKGSAVGISLGIGLQGQVTPDTVYSIEYKLNQFDFEDDVLAGGLDLSYEENFSTFYIGLTHFFE